MSDYVSTIAKRNERLIKIRNDEKLLAASKIYYKTHPIDFINDWVFTYDPRKKPSVLPFILFKRQEEYIKWLWQRFENKEDGLVEKSRDMGLTWLSMAYAIWMWLFHEGVKIGFGSRKEDLVDRIGDPDCIFEKGRMILRYLPKEFLPKDFDVSKHCPHMKIINPANDSAIIGESGKEIGRGGRSSMYFKDESAFYEQPKRIDAALSQNSDVKIDISTPNGEGNPFHQKRVGGKIEVFQFHWRDDPRKDDNWYKEQCEKLDPVIVAQEIDIDYAASAENILIPSKWVQAAVNLKLPASGARFAGLDVADEGGDINAFVSRKGVVVDFVEGWKEGDPGETTSKAYNYCIQLGVKNFAYDGLGVGAGAKTTIKRLIKADSNKHKINVTSFIASASVTDDKYDEEKENSDLFKNLKAEMSWKMRRRFQRTYEHVNGIREWPVDELISIPNHAELISEISRIRREPSDDGKMKVMSKPKLKKLGIKSPNYFDALVMCFYNDYFSYSGW